MKKINYLSVFLIIILAFLSSCKNDKPVFNITSLSGDKGWYGDTVKFSVNVEANESFSLKITNNHDFQVYENNFAAGSNTVEYGYVVPTDLTEGDIVSISFAATLDGDTKTETVVKDITITINGNGEVIYHHGTITTNETWSASNTHIVDNDLIISGCKVLIEPGSVIRIQQGLDIVVEGQNSGITATATAQAPITFTSSLAAPQAGDWKYIQFKDGSNSTINYCIFKYGGDNSSWGMIDIQSNALVSIDNCTFSDFKEFAIEAEEDNGFVSFTNNTITIASGHAMKIRGKHVQDIGSGNVFNVDVNSGILVTGSSSNYIYITENATWLKQSCAYFIEDEITIKNNSTLTIQAGAVLKFLSGVYLQVGYSSEYGKLIAEGTETEKIVFTSASPNPIIGDWGSIRFSTTATNSILKYCEISYGGYSSSYKGNIAVEPCGNENPVIENCEIHHSKYYGVYKDKVSGNWGNPLLTNNNYHDNTMGDVGQD